jgi:uncharacterized membrane protein
MKEVYAVPENLFGSMVVVDIAIGNLWLAFLLVGAGRSHKIDRWLRADASAIAEVKERLETYSAQTARIPNLAELTTLLAVAFGGTALAHLLADVVLPLLEPYSVQLQELGLHSLLSGFFWLVVFATTIGLLLSFTRFKKLEAVGAMRFGSLFIYILVAAIGMQMNLQQMFSNWAQFRFYLLIGLIWMIIHAGLLMLVGRLIKAPFFFLAVGSQANVGGAASAPVVAAAFSPALAPVGVLLAVLGYALGTYGAIVCAELMRWVAE